jgi:hypothetical protein
MKLIDVRVEPDGDRVRVAAHIEGTPVQPYLAFPRAMESFVSGTADAFLPALLVPCVERGEPLEIIPPVSPQLACRIPCILDTLLALFPNFHRVEVKLRARGERQIPSGSSVAALFSGGVDSFYTLLKALSPESDPTYRPTHLLFMRGLEQRLDESAGADSTLRVVDEVARATGVGVLWGETNLRMLFGLNYELYYHAAALVGSALALSRGVKCLLVPSTYSYGQLIPWGSHPILDELWSTERMQVIHHGAEARRVDKIACLAQRYPLALRRLRVCLKNHAGPGNCGNCQKCARTMMALEIVGVLGSVPTFPQVSRRSLERSLLADSPIFVEELRDFARRTGRSETLQFLDRVVRKQKRHYAAKALMESTPVLANIMPRISHLRRRLRGQPVTLQKPEFLGQVQMRLS